MAEWRFPAPLGITSSVTSYPEPTGLLGHLAPMEPEPWLKNWQIESILISLNGSDLRSPLTESNRRPSPYHGDALPTELRGQAAWR
jgi:hypothetical protein